MHKDRHVVGCMLNALTCLASYAFNN